MGSQLLTYTQSEYSRHHKDVVKPFVRVEKVSFQPDSPSSFKLGEENGWGYQDE